MDATASGASGAAATATATAVPHRALWSRGGADLNARSSLSPLRRDGNRAAAAAAVAAAAAAAARADALTLLRARVNVAVQAAAAVAQQRSVGADADGELDDVPSHAALDAEDVSSDDFDDDDDDYAGYMRRYLRRKSDLQMKLQQQRMSEITEGTLSCWCRFRQCVVERSRKKVRVAKRKGAVSAVSGMREIPFSDPRYHKTVAALVLSHSDIVDDLARMYGRTVKVAAWRGGEMRDAGGGAECESAGVGGVRTLTEGDGVGGSGSCGLGGCDSCDGCDRSSQRSLFVKHRDKKGWVVCTRCLVAVWPPNCAKHVAHCSRNK